jgi:hypothetical protein
VCLDKQKIDPKLIGNPWYWLYRVTRDELDQEVNSIPFGKTYSEYKAIHYWNKCVCNLLDQETLDLIIQSQIIRDIDDDFLSSDEETTLFDKITQKIFNLMNKKPPYTSLAEWMSNGANSHGRTIFTNCEWFEDVDFEGFYLLSMWADTSIFYKKVNLTRAIFISPPSSIWGYHIFYQSVFHSDVYLKNIALIGNYSFDRYPLEACLTEAIKYTVSFEECMFKGNVFFSNYLFSTKDVAMNISYKASIFEGDIIFIGHSEPDSPKLTYKISNNSTLSFKNAYFKGERNHFNNMCIEGSLILEMATFDKTFNFTGTKFRTLPDCTGTEFRGGIDLTNIKFPDNPHGDLKFNEAVNTWRQFRQSLTSYHNRELENRLLINEFDAEIYNTDSCIDYQVTFNLLSRTFDMSTLWNKIKCVFLYALANLKKFIVFNWQGIICVLYIYFFIRGIFKPIYDFNVVSVTISILILIWGFHYFNRLGEIPYRQVILSLYRLTSLYGTSFIRPVVFWCIQVAFFTGVYYSFAENNEKYAWRLSLAESAIISSSADKEHYNMLLCENFKASKKDVCVDNPNMNSIKMMAERHTQFPLLRYLQKILSGVLIFLFGLGVRNYLKLR